MTLENQVVSPDLAKRLKELGVKQESCFYWGHQMINIGGSTSRTGTELYDHKYGNALIPEASAFTVAELGEVIRKWESSTEMPIYQEWHVKNNAKYKGRGVWACEINEDNTQWFEAETEADARAKMLIYLLENNLIIP